MTRLALAKAIYLVHLLCIAFLLFAWLLPTNYLAIHIVLVPLVILQWLLNKNQCVLTQIQHNLEGQKLNNSEGRFVKDLFAKANLSPTDRQLKGIIYATLLLSLIVSVVRYFKFL